MLKDTIRTDAYRDFIYDNKHLFANKVVLDVGCGTGILSLFCARAGAAKVFAVDNSSIIEKARANIAANGLADVIECLQGKVEEIKLPVAQVDVIVSEWMGYCLLFEAMLPSVLWARDRYLKPDGLMVPSHCVLHVAPVADPAFVADNVEFWHDVYGFNMQAMMDKIYDDVLIRHSSPETMAGPSDPFLVLPLHTAQVSDLTFRKPFLVTVSETIENLDGWALWFDTFFLPSRSSFLPLDARAEHLAASDRPGNAFTTGPAGKETHWRAGVMIIDRSKKPPRAIPRGTKITGSIGYAENGANKRGLEIEITWHVDGTNQHGQQIWYVH
jgi:type I protein arginine methyltransferase